MNDDESALKPTPTYPANPDPKLPPARYWVIDGKRQIRFVRSDKDSGTTVETRELLVVKARLKHMDELGTDIPVIYPTLFLMEATEKPEINTAMRKSYNRWLGDRCSESGGRLRWVCMPPLQNMEESLVELRWAKDHGACGVLKKGDREAGKYPADSYFEPLYAEAAKLDLPICIHTGSRVAFPNCESVASRRARCGRRSWLTISVGNSFGSRDVRVRACSAYRRWSLRLMFSKRIESTLPARWTKICPIFSNAWGRIT